MLLLLDGLRTRAVKKQGQLRARGCSGSRAVAAVMSCGFYQDSAAAAGMPWPGLSWPGSGSQAPLATLHFLSVVSLQVSRGTRGLHGTIPKQHLPFLVTKVGFCLLQIKTMIVRLGVFDCPSNPLDYQVPWKVESVSACSHGKGLGPLRLVFNWQLMNEWINEWVLST